MKDALQWVWERARAMPGLWVGLAGTGILFRDLLGTDLARSQWGNGFDPQLMHWTVEWGYHSLFGPAKFWEANSFYPESLTLAYSDSLAGFQVFYAPLRALGFAPLTALYLTLGGFCVLGSVLTQHALKRIGTFTNMEIALIVFGAHFSLSMVGYFHHYQLFGFHLAPPFFLFTYVYLRDFRKHDLIAVCLCYALGTTVAMYLAPFLLSVTAFASIPLVISAVRTRGFKGLALAVGWASPLIVAVFSFLFFELHVRPYVDVARRFTESGMDQAIPYSAYWWSLFKGFSHYSHWYAPSGNAWGAWEYWYFPGYVLLGAAAALSIALVVTVVRKRDLPLPSDLLLYTGSVFVLAWVLSWGPAWRPVEKPLTHLPYYFIAYIVPGLESIRSPGRFGMFLGLPLAISAVALIRALVASPRVRTWVVAGVLVAVAVESIPAYPVHHPFDVDPAGTYAKVGEVIDPGTPLLELPALGSTDLETVMIALQQLNGSTRHWGRIVPGYGAHRTRAYGELLDLDRRLQAGEIGPGRIIDFARRLGIEHVLVHIDDYALPQRAQWGALLASRTTSPLLSEPGVRLVRFDYDSAQAPHGE